MEMVTTRPLLSTGHRVRASVAAVCLVAPFEKFFFLPIILLDFPEMTGHDIEERCRSLIKEVTVTLVLDWVRGVSRYKCLR